MAKVFTGGEVPLNVDELDVGLLLSGTYNLATSSQIEIQTDPNQVVELSGDFTFDASGHLAGGTLNEIKDLISGSLVFDISGFSVSAASFVGWVNTDDNATAKATILAGDDVISGTPFNDVLRGFGGDDTFIASPGIDLIDGGTGVNTVVYHNSFINYVLATTTFGTWTTQDQTPGAPDGTDTLVSIQDLQFTDRTVVIGAPPSAATLQALKAEFAQVFRVNPDQVLASSPQHLADGGDNPTLIAAALVLPFASELDSALTNPSAVAMQLAHFAGPTTSVATLAYEFFTGQAPSAAGLDFLISPSGGNPNNLNSAYYQAFSLENRYINFAVNLGEFGQGSANFAAAYGSLDLAGATKLAYQTIFGAAPSDAKVAAILDAPLSLGGQTISRADYFALYGQDGPNGIGTKAAVVGWLLAEAQKADIGVYALSNDAFLSDVALHNAPFGVDFVGVYAQPGFVFTPG